MYSNRFTRENPGLIVFLVDQSGSTEDIMSMDGHTIADHIADLVNACITEAIKQATIQTSDDEEEVKHEIVEEINSNDIMFKSVTLVDTITGTPYKIYAANHYIHLSNEAKQNMVESAVSTAYLFSRDVVCERLSEEFKKRIK